MSEKTLEQKVQTRMVTVCVLSFFAAAIVAYLLYIHYVPEANVCEWNKLFSCNEISKNPRAELFGVPIAAIGLLYYLCMAVIALAWVKKFDFQKMAQKLRPGLILKMLFGATFVGVLFTLYLSYIEFFELKTICPPCVLQQVIILIIFGLLYSIRISIDIEKGKTQTCELC